MLHTISLTLSRVGADTLPEGRVIDLPGRGATRVYDQPGPACAPTLLLLHGLAATGPLNWFPAFGPLSERHRVVAVDLRGHGHGLPVSGRFRFSVCADDVVAIADALGIDRFVPVGYSLGGPVAQLVWRRHRDRVDGLVLCATSRNFGGRPHEKVFFASLWSATYALALARRFLPRPSTPDGEVAEESSVVEGTPLPRWALDEMRRCSPAALIGATQALGRFSSHEWIHEVDVPTAVVVTTKDRLVSPARQLKLANAIPGATIHPAHTDHAACVLGAKRFVPALVEACGSVAARMPA